MPRRRRKRRRTRHEPAILSRLFSGLRSNETPNRRKLISNNSSLSRIKLRLRQSANELRKLSQTISAKYQTRNRNLLPQSQKSRTAASERQAVDEIPRGPASNPIDAGLAQSSPVTKTMLKSVFFDVGSGIKTTVLVDGSIHEEPFDLTALSNFISENGSLSGIVHRLRNPSRAEVTGSVSDDLN